MSRILLRNITLDGGQKDIFIDGNLISRIEPANSIASDRSTHIMDCSGKAAVPGFINMHTHAAMSLMRGIGEDMVFQDWINKIWKIEEHIDYEFVYWSAKVACLEMIRTGTTTFNDQYWFFSAARQAAVDMGIRPVLGYDVMDKGDPKEAQREREQCIKKYEQFSQEWDENSIYAVAFHAIYSVSEEMILWIDKFARERKLRLHIHLAETIKEVEDCKKLHGGLTPVEYLDSLGVLGPHILAAHTLWLSPHDIELLAKHGVHCIHNINSNAKLCSGYQFLYNELRDAGVNVCIGTDGSASSNNLDMLEAMKTSALFQKAWRSDPKAWPLDELLACATSHGAKALGLNSGVIEAGRIADINIVDTDNSFFLSDGPFLANLIYSAHADCIETVICNGRIVMCRREIPGEREILAEARRVLNKIK